MNWSEAKRFMGANEWAPKSQGVTSGPRGYLYRARAGAHHSKESRRAASECEPASFLERGRVDKAGRREQKGRRVWEVAPGLPSPPPQSKASVGG